jgi:Raf kinase inhibitor-like YbhB/YbcL family protein
MRTGYIVSACIIIAVFVASLLVGGCSSQTSAPVETGQASLVLTSNAFASSGALSARYTCNGEGVSPPLTWDNVPAGTRSFALVLEDPDAPAGTFTHWVLYNIPGEQRELPADLPLTRELEGGAIQGINSYKKTGYSAPCPPTGSTHRYILTLWALDDRLDLSGMVDAATLKKAMEGHILGSGQLTGTYRGV